MDSDFGGVSDWAANPYQGWFAEGQAFMGYPALAILQQRTEYRAIVETFAQEMTRKWIKFTSKGDDDKTGKLAQIEDEFERLEVRDRFRECAEKDGFLGRSHLFADFGDWEKSEELKTSIGDGRDQASLQKLKGKKLERLRTIEATWVYPSIYNSTDPLAPDWYKPKSWFVMSKEVHASRLMTFIGREVPDILKPAYAFGGLSISQMVKPYVDYWLGIRSSAGDIVQAFSVFVLSTDLSQTLMEGGDQLFRRAELFNRVRRNSGLMMINKDTEDFKNVAAPLAGLHELVAQAQEHMCVRSGTLIETTRGQVPIEDVTVSDRVMTRNGYAPVAWAGITKYTSQFVEIEADGSTIHVTEEHGIWSEGPRQFVPAKNVDHSHFLKKSPAWGNTADQSLGADAYGASPLRDIIGTPKEAAFYIASFMRRILGLFQMESISTIWTKTQAITYCPILPFSLVPNTKNSMNRKGLCARLGTNSRNDASSAMAYFSRLGQIARSIVPTLVVADPIKDSARLMGGLFISKKAEQKNIAANAGIHISRQNQRYHSFARQNAAARHMQDGVRVRAARFIRVAAEPVYDISVADGYLPEFYANGILVHNCSPAKIPLVKLTGISPSGLNASSDGEMRCFNDEVHSRQELLFRANLMKILGFVQIGLFGEVDPNIGFEFEPLYELSEKEQAEVRKIEAETGQILVDTGAISQEEERARVAADPSTPYAGLDPDDMPDLESEEETGLVVRGEKGEGAEDAKRALDRFFAEVVE